MQKLVFSKKVAWTLPSSATGQTDGPAPLAAVLSAIVTAFYLCRAVQLSLHTGTRKGIFTSKKVSHLFIKTNKKTNRKIQNVKYFFHYYFAWSKNEGWHFSPAVLKVVIWGQIVLQFLNSCSPYNIITDIIWLLCQNDKETRLIKTKF